MRYNPEIHHRRSIRLKGYDYARAGAYFVTICSQNREGVLGEVIEDEVRLSDAGHVVAGSWQWLAEQYPYVELDAWVVMPNHLHGVIVVHADDCPAHDDANATVGARRDAPLPGDAPDVSRRKPLGQLIGAFKTVSTKQVNELRGTAGAVLWQRNYYEHIMRDEAELNRARQYIANNPRRWALDRENPLGVGAGG